MIALIATKSNRGGPRNSRRALLIPLVYGSLRILYGALDVLDLLKCCFLQASQQEWLVSDVYDRGLAEHTQKEGDELGLH